MHISERWDFSRQQWKTRDDWRKKEPKTTSRAELVVLIKHSIRQQLPWKLSVSWLQWVIITYSFLFPGCSSVHPEGTASGPSCTPQWWLFCGQTRWCIMKDKQGKRDIFCLHNCQKKVIFKLSGLFLNSEHKLCRREHRCNHLPLSRSLQHDLLCLLHIYTFPPFCEFAWIKPQPVHNS